MADVNEPGRSGRDRGQMILVAAFGVAVMLVALALMLNTSIYTENLATRGSDISGGKDALQYRSVTESTMVSIVQRVNANNNSTSGTNADYEALEGPARRGVWNYSNLSGAHNARNAIVTNVTVTDQSNGTHVFQRDDGNFSNESDVGNWTVATDTGGVRAFSMNVTRSSLSSEARADVDIFSEVFRVNFSSGGTYYRVFVYDSDDQSGSVGVKVVDDGGTSNSCEVEYGDYGGNDRAVVDLTNASVEGEPCPALEGWFPVNNDPLTLHFNNTCTTLSGDDNCDDTLTDPYNVSGTYSLIVNETLSETNIEPGDPGPNATTALYSMSVHFTYESNRLYMESDLRAAPGEPDD